jgi:TolB-like protein/Flp pilus assembly protein TadD
MGSLWSRLRERKLVQWALAYLGGAWLLLQVTGVLSQGFELPPAFFRSAAVVLGVGFFAALVIAWYHGEKGSQRVSGPELLMLSALFLMAGVGLAWVGPHTTVASPTAEPGLPPPTPAAVDLRSVAVLPFTNLSDNKENEYFSDGITEEILLTLTNIGSLRVISRTSVMQYKDSTKPAPQIASELGVAHLLTGSVQRERESVRIRVQLIDPHSDVTLWAERYDRPLEDVFAVQSEIAQQIARALRVSLNAGERVRIERRPTISPLAHEYVLRARNLLQLPIPGMTDAAVDLTSEALVLDPTYADAFAAHAQALVDRYWRRGEAIWLDSAIAAARQAISLDPEFAPGYAELGSALNLQGDRESALEAHRRAVALNPNLSGGLANLYEYDYGHLDEAVHLWERELETDPTNATTLFKIGRIYLHLGMPAHARTLFDRGKKVQPDYPWAHYYTSLAYILEGRPQEAQSEVQRMLAAREGAIQDLQVAVQSGWRLYNGNPNDPILNSLQGNPRYDGLIAAVKADIARMRTRIERARW